LELGDERSHGATFVTGSYDRPVLWTLAQFCNRTKIRRRQEIDIEVEEEWLDAVEHPEPIYR